MDHTPEQLTADILNALRAAHGLATAELDHDDPKHQLPASYRATAQNWKTLHDALAGVLLLPVPAPTLAEYAERTDEQRQAQRDDIAAYVDHLSDSLAALLLAEAAITARQVFPTAASFLIDVADDNDDEASLHAIHDSDGQTLWHHETCGCGPLSEHPEHLTARRLETLFVTAFSYDRLCADELDRSDEDSPDYDADHKRETYCYRVTLPDLG